MQKEKTYSMIVTHVDKKERIVFGEIFEQLSFINNPKLNHVIACALFDYENFDETEWGDKLQVKFVDFNLSSFDNRYDIIVKIADK